MQWPSWRLRRSISIPWLKGPARGAHRSSLRAGSGEARLPRPQQHVCARTYAQQLQPFASTDPGYRAERATQQLWQIRRAEKRVMAFFQRDIPGKSFEHSFGTIQARRRRQLPPAQREGGEVAAEFALSALPQVLFRTTLGRTGPAPFCAMPTFSSLVSEVNVSPSQMVFSPSTLL